MKQDGILVNGRCFIDAALFPQDVRALAVTAKVDFHMIDGTVYLDAEHMREAVEQDNEALRQQTAGTWRTIRAYAMRHPLCYLSFLLRRGVSFLFGI